MHFVTFLSSTLLAVPLLASASETSSPPISAVLKASWPAPELVVQYFESLALESEGALFPFLHYLAANPSFPLKAALTSTYRSALNPILTPYLLPNETYTLLEERLDKSMLLRDRGMRDLLRLGLAQREGSVRLEGMRRVWSEREKELKDSRSDCESWVDVGGKKICSVEEFWAAVGNKEGSEPLTWSGSNKPSHIYPFDHLSPHLYNDKLPLLIFYASPTSPSFSPLFSLLYSLSSPSATIPPEPALHPSEVLSPRIQLALRWKPDSKTTSDKMIMSGYGAGLDIKRSDYLVVDDRLSASNGKEDQVETGSENRPKMLPVRKEDIAELGLHAASYILAAESPLDTFLHLTSSFPLLASSLSRYPASAELTSEILLNQMTHVAATTNSFVLNGITLTADSIDPFALLRNMRKERKIITDIQKLHKTMKTREAREILTFKGIGAASKPSVGLDGKVGIEILGELFDASDVKEGGDLIVWWNDLERDKRYKTWSTQIGDLLRPSYPGQLNQIARNINNVILVVDLSFPNVLTLIASNVNSFVSRGIPIRFGVVPLVGEDGDTSTMIAKILWYLVENVGRASAMSFLGDLSTAKGATPEATLRATYARLVESTETPLATLDEVQAGQVELTAKARAYAQRLGVKVDFEAATVLSGAFFLNGAHFALDEDFIQILQKTMGAHLQFLQQQVYFGEITEETDIGNYFYTAPSTYGSRNPYIFPSEARPLKIVNLADAFKGVNGAFAQDSFIAGTPELGSLEDVTPVASMIVVTDLESTSGRALVIAALRFLNNNPTARLSFLHNPVDLSVTSHPHQFANLLYLLLKSKTLAEVLPNELLSWLDIEQQLVLAEKIDTSTFLPENPITIHLNKGAIGEEAKESESYWNSIAPLAQRFGFSRGESGLIINGRTLGPLLEDFTVTDFQGLFDYELAKRIQPIVDALDASTFDIDSLKLHARSNAYAVATSVVSEAYLADPAAGLFGAPAVARAQLYRDLDSTYSAYVDEKEDSALFEIGVVIDPATEVAQRWAPILKTLSELPSVHLRIHFNPSQTLTEIPIKRFYQSTFDSSLSFHNDTGVEKQSGLTFEGIPEDVLFTFAMDTQRSWLAFPQSCIHDLDNIKLADLPRASRAEGVSAIFELESIILEGHVRDMPSSAPPRGLQLELLSASAETVGTIVMANFGYFQLKANPGSFDLQIRAGKSSEVFEFESIGAEGWKSDVVSTTGTSLVILTLEGLTIYPRVTRKPGQELTQLLDDNAAARAATKGNATVVDKLKSMFPFLAPKDAGADSKALVDTGKRAEINIFTVASGLLYERMATLMIVSVLRHTDSRVKFWFIQNFLSPSFKAFIPHMAREYDFDYELVTYQWPHWLRSQKEKQRTIWGYKILFLDVLFPLELERVIFVDSDLIVRSDLKELVNLDLEGAPYAYAPMGNDREETKGFRFWDQGYWKDHLRGQPYHISALYVVDLDRFRQIAAGDRLRQHYQGLSADPNSLANLDQDLPNNMYNSLPIYTLDKSWLWCETWCSDESLVEAKAIDLCNNPLTHEPKLQRAKRMIPEWTVYDDEIAKFASTLAASASSNMTPGATPDGQVGALNAFTKKADELGQAKLQGIERDEFELSQSIEDEQVAEPSADSESDSPEGETAWVKDEL